MPEQVLQSRLDAVHHSCFFFSFLRGIRAARGRRRCWQQQQVNLLLGGWGLQSSQSPTRLWLLEKGRDPHFQKKGIGGYIRNARHSFLFFFFFRYCARQVWPLPWHLPKCCSEILSITGLEVSEGIPNMARTHGLSRRINRYLTPQTVISHHEARLSANSLCPVLQIYAAFYTSEPVYIELQHNATSTNPNLKVFFSFLKGAEQVKKKKARRQKYNQRSWCFLCYSGRRKKTASAFHFLSLRTCFAVVASPRQSRQHCTTRLLMKGHGLAPTAQCRNSFIKTTGGKKKKKNPHRNDAEMQCRRFGLFNQRDARRGRFHRQNTMTWSGLCFC